MAALIAKSVKCRGLSSRRRTGVLAGADIGKEIVSILGQAFRFDFASPNNRAAGRESICDNCTHDVDEKTANARLRQRADRLCSRKTHARPYSLSACASKRNSAASR